MAAGNAQNEFSPHSRGLILNRCDYSKDPLRLVKDWSTENIRFIIESTRFSLPNYTLDEQRNFASYSTSSTIQQFRKAVCNYVVKIIAVLNGGAAKDQIMRGHQPHVQIATVVKEAVELLSGWLSKIKTTPCLTWMICGGL